MLEYTAARGPLAHDLVSSCKMQLQRAKHCIAAYNVRSVDKLSGRTTGRLGGNRQDTAHTIGGTTVVMTPGRQGAAGAWATAAPAGDRQRGLRAGWSRVHSSGAAGAAGASRDYGLGRPEAAEAHAHSV
jgi:hypothetical protein